MYVDVTKANELIQAVKNAAKQAEFNERISKINILDKIVSKGNNTFKLTTYNIWKYSSSYHWRQVALCGNKGWITWVYIRR
ncbi:hypothetical protein [Clostridium estertheticum]|uniref:hypothetical protein n=1 Tax=Clostridium estertheticum TaxID=238834 RepID=UPI001CF5A2AB|nr:hypothetical protein [Clostridium estertheticum]MCB2342611.1 hypothetical protein [Clostridium estertheticum]